MPKELEPEDFYKTPEGFIVFTEAYHLKRGHCCQSGCKHCPYGCLLYTSPSPRDDR